MKKLFLFALLFSLEETTYAQSGFDFGVYGHSTIKHNSLESSPSPYQHTTQSRNRSAGAGVFIKFNLNEHFSLRLSPGYTQERDQFSGVWYPPMGDFPNSYKDVVKTIYLTAPLHVLYSPGRNGIYFLAGATTFIRLKENVDGPYPIHLKKYDYTADIGIGYKLKIGRVQIAPEIRYGKSLVNGLRPNVYEDSNYSRSRLTASLFVSLGKPKK